MKEPTTESVQQNEKNFYLMLRLEKDQSTDEIKIKTVEREVYQKAGNPLPTQGVFDGKHLFTCELTGKNGEIIRKVEQKINLDLGPAKNEGILKFIVPFPKEAYHVEVKHLTLDGVWITIYSDKL